jgi:hypothetical protein
MSQSLSTLCRPCDDIMSLIGEAVAKHRQFLTRQYHVDRYVTCVQLPMPDAMGDCAYRKQLVDNWNHSLIVGLMTHIATDNRYFAGIDGRPVPTLPSDVQDPLPTRGEKGNGLFGWSETARESRFSRNQAALDHRMLAIRILLYKY